MDWDKALAIATLWLIVAATAFAADWYTIIPATAALAGTVAIAQS